MEKIPDIVLERTKLKFDMFEKRNLEPLAKELHVDLDAWPPDYPKDLTDLLILRALQLRDPRAMDRLRSMWPRERGEKTELDVDLPKELVAQDLTDYLKGVPEAYQDPRIIDDIKSFDMRFFALKHGFGVAPGPDQTVEEVRYTATLTPACQKGDRCIHTYGLVPITTGYPVQADGEVEVGPNLAFYAPQNPSFQIAGLKRIVYETSVKFPRSRITATTNSKEMMSWQFDYMRGVYTVTDPADTEKVVAQMFGLQPDEQADLRGYFKMASTIGIPSAFGKELRKKVKARIFVKAQVNDWIFNSEHQKREAQILFT